MRNLIFLLLLIPNLVLAECQYWEDGTLKWPCEEAQGSPFEFLEELVDGVSEDKQQVNDPKSEKKQKNQNYYSDGGGYDPSSEPQNYNLPIISSKIKLPSPVPKQEKIEFLDTQKNNVSKDIYEMRFDGDSFWAKNELIENCDKLDFEEYKLQTQSVATNVQFLYLEETPLQHKTDLSVDQIDNDKFKYQITVKQSSQHNLMTAEIIANYYIYNYQKKMPLLEITTDECQEVRFNGFTINPLKAKSISKEWYENDYLEEVAVIGFVPTMTLLEGALNLNDFPPSNLLHNASSDSMTKFTIVCKAPQCKQRAEKSILVDLKSEKKIYDKKMKEQAIEEEKRIKKEAIEWKRQKKLEMEQAIEEEKAEKLRQKEEQLNKVRDASLTDLNDEQKKLKIDDAKAQCKEIGYESGSKKFKECIVELL